MTIHHTIIKNAEKFGIIMSEVDTDNGTVAKAHWAEYNQTFVHPDPKKARDAAILQQTFTREYPNLQLVNGSGNNWPFHVVAADDVAEILVEDADVSDKAAVLADALERCEELGIDPEAGYEEPEDTGQIVPSKYRTEYAEAGHPDDCGDFLAEYSRGLALEEFIAMCAENGVVPTAKLNKAMDIQTRGWQGRVRMSMGLMLRKAIEMNGEFVHLGKPVKMR